MSSPHPYSRLERILHTVAFRTTFAQKVVADLEDQIFARRLRAIQATRPVFITSLPRAGTTLLLELFSGLPDFASHTYRDMPFVMVPVLWETMSRRFRKSAELKERAHGDGVQIGFDSPEAFEEIVWKAFWRDKYGDDRIGLWSEKDRDAEFEIFFRNHMGKIVALRRSDAASPATPRYVSKNNANLARLPLLVKLFPDCRIVIPIRNPVSHIRSLRSQHRRFTELHAQDDFSRKYMAGLGHFEFGKNLKPIDFADWLGRAGSKDPATPEFWLHYWIEASETILAAAGPNVIFLDYDGLCEEPRRSLTALAEAVGLASPSDLIALAARIRPGAASPGTANAVATSPLEARAAALYEALKRRSIQSVHASRERQH